MDLRTGKLPLLEHGYDLQCALPEPLRLACDMGSLWPIVTGSRLAMSLRASAVADSSGPQLLGPVFGWLPAVTMPEQGTLVKCQGR